MASIEDEDREYTFISLSSTVHDGLVTKRHLKGITVEFEHHHLYHVSITCSCSQVNGLRAHVRVSMLGQLPHDLIISIQLSPQDIK